MKKKLLGGAKSFRNNYLALTIIALSLFATADAQVYQINAGYGFMWKRNKTDSTQLIPTFNGVPTLRNSTVINQGAIAIDSTNNRFYFYNPRTLSWNLAGGGGGTTTSGISKLGSPTYGLIRVNDSTYRVDSTIILDTSKIKKFFVSTCLNYDSVNRIFSVDTACVLAYVKSQVATNSALIAGKLNISDTASMLSVYLRSNVATATYATIANLALKLAIADTASMLSPYARTNALVAGLGLKLNITDTVIFNNQFIQLRAQVAANKTNISTNTANILLKKDITDSTNSISGYTTLYQNSLKGRVDSIRFINSGLIHTTPAAFSLAGQTAVITQTLANQSAYTVLGNHTAGSSTPTFGKVALANEVTGLLPIANGGTGTATPGIVAGTNVTVSGSWPNQTVNSAGGGGGGTAIDTVQTIALLKSYAGTGRYVQVTDTLRGGLFFYSTVSKTPDSTLVYAANGKGSGYWVRNMVGNDKVWVTWAGATKDSTQDATPFVQLAVNSAIANNHHTVFLPAGFYTFSAL